MKGNVLVLFFCFLLLFSSGLAACDVNLVAMFAGQNPDDVFLQMVLALAQDTRALGQAFNNRKETRAVLQSLMLRWLKFDNRYSQDPPLWAKKDLRWHAKLKKMADLIGNIQKNYLQNNPLKAHHQVLSLSRKLATLLSGLPMAPALRTYLGFTQDFENIWGALYEKDRFLFGQAVASLSLEIKGFRGKISSEKRDVTDDFFARVAKLQLRCGDVPASITWKIRNDLELAEEALNQMNRRWIERFSDDKNK